MIGYRIGSELSCTCILMMQDLYGVPMSIDERLDPETGLYTRHVFGLLFNHEIARTHRYPSPLVLLRIAMQCNPPSKDTLTEDGSACVARVLSNNLRHVDVPAQFGDDYLVLLPATDEAGGTTVGKRLLQQFQRNYCTQSGDKPPSKIHIGLAAHSGGPTASAETILVQASKALEEARQRGLNSIVNFREISTLGI
jgi:diguanylate cyclase (GGDEF)-like protein